MAEKAYVKWDGGALEAEASGAERLALRASNYRLVLAPRSVEVVGRYSPPREHPQGNRKTLFIGLPEGVKPLNPPRVDIAGRGLLGYFELLYTDLGFEHYLTVIVPAEYLYDYVVLTSDELMLHMSARRSAYFEETPYDRITVYLR